MNVNVFDVLMLVSLGSLIGTGAGILIAYFAKKQHSEWSAMSSREQTISLVLMITFSAICCGILGYYLIM